MVNAEMPFSTTPLVRDASRIDPMQALRTETPRSAI
jgi:hypothetical protein